MIELRETHYSYGTEAKVIGLYTATVMVTIVERAGHPAFQVRTSRKSNGSVRYSYFNTYKEATTYALVYANRVYRQKNEREARETVAILRQRENQHAS